MSEQLFPEHIYNLAKESTNDRSILPILSDALEEVGLIHSAVHFRSEQHSMGKGTCGIIDVILTSDIHEMGHHPARKELELYQTTKG